MDNKKWSKRFSTIFWWVLAFLPLFSALIAMIGYNSARLNSISDINDISSFFATSDNSLAYFLGLQFSDVEFFSFGSFIPSFCFDLFSRLFRLIINNDLIDYDAWSYLFAWATWIFIVHVIFDIIIWLPCFLHDLIDRFKK